MQGRSFGEEILRYSQVVADATVWACEACTAHNNLDYIQCSECFTNNDNWKKLLDALSLPYKKRELDVAVTVQGLFRSWQKSASQGAEESLWDLLSVYAGYLHISDSWKCRCGTFLSPSHIICSHCYTRNSPLQALLDLIEFPYTNSVSEHVEEDPIPVSLLEPMEHHLHVSAGLLVWVCPQCTAENSTEYVQCKECHWVNDCLETFNTLLGVPILRTNVPLYLRLLTGKREGNGEGSGLLVLKARLEAVTGLAEPYQLWTCPSCTLANSYEYPMCRLCPYVNSPLQEILKALNLTAKQRRKDIVTIAKEAYHSILDIVHTATVCPICETIIRSIEITPLADCGHIFHPACLKEHIQATMQGAVKCPNVGCAQEISTQDIKRFLSAYEFERYLEVALKKYMASQGDKMRACPTPDCPFSFIFDGEREFTCLHCYKSYCLRCHSNAHSPDSCEDHRLRLRYIPTAGEPMALCPVCKYRFREQDQGLCANCKVKYCLKCHVSHPYWTCVEYFRTLQKESNEDLFVQFASGSKFKICGKCGVWVEKQAGCNHITCRCGHQFCYICGKDWLLGQCRDHQFQ